MAGTRQAKKIRSPRTRNGGEWTEARFFTYIRSGLRLLSRRWPPRRQVLLDARRPYTGPVKQRKWEYLCSVCSNWFPEKEVQVDHIHECGTLKTFLDASGFIERLLCEKEGMRCICKKCHLARRNEE